MLKMAKREFFPCYHSYFKKCEKLTDQELGRLFRALLQYSSTGERQELAGRESIAFDFIADDIDRADEAYQSRCKDNTINGQLGGRPKKQTVSKKPSGFFETQKENKDEEKREGEDSLPPVPPSRGAPDPAQKDKPQKPQREEWGFGPELTEAFRAWLRYKAEKRQPYKPEGLKALVTETRHNAERYGEAAVAALIRKCMSANWQGIIWDRLPKMAQGAGDGKSGGSGDAWKYV